MATIQWLTGVSGDWNTASDWSTGTVPGAGDDVTISASGTYTVTISAAEAAHSLTIDDAGATVSDSGTLTITSTLTVSAGTFELNSGGTIAGGTLSATGGTFAFDGGTLNGVTYDGTLDLSPNSSSVIITNGLTATGVSGTGPGTVNLTGISDYVYFEGTQTFDKATINLGSSTGYDDAIYQYDNTGAGNETLTLGPNLIVNAASTNYVYIGTYYDYTGDGIVNEGTINAEGTNGRLFETALNFTNEGTITVTNGETFYEYYNFTNAAGAALSITGTGSTGYLGYGGSSYSWSNAGTITIGSGAALYLYNSFTTAQLGTITANGGSIAGTVYLEGTLTNSGASVDVGAGTALPQVVLASSGTIVGGTIVDEGSGLVFSGGTLNGVTYDGTLDLSPNSSSVIITNGLTATGVSGTGPGTANLTGISDYVYFEGTQTFDKATINLGSSTGYDDAIYQYDNTGAGNETLTLGPNLIVNAASTNYVYIGTYYDYTGDGIVNEGTINAEGTNGRLFETALNFTNEGTITVTNGETFYEYYNFTNAAGAALSITGTGSTGYLGYGGSSYSWSNAGTITIGSGAALYLYNSFTTAQLGTITANGGSIAGTVYLEGTLTNSGASVDVGAGTALPHVVLASSGTIVGGTIVDEGSGLVFSGGTLNGVTYDGTLDLSPNSSSVIITNGLTATGVSGTGPGTANLTGISDYVYFEGMQTFDKATINLGSSTGYDDAIYQYDNTGAGNETLTLGPNLIVNAASTNYVYIGTYYDYTGDGIVNEGTINAEGTNGRLFETALNFTNEGTITVTNGETFYEYYNFTNAAGAALSITGTGSTGYLAYSSGGLTNTGTFEATNGGLLDVTAALAGAGQLMIGAGSEIELGGATSQNATFLGASNAKLRINNARTITYGGTIASFAAGDILELGSTVATSATPGTFNGTTTSLTVNLSGGGTLTYTLAGDLSSDTFNVTLVNGGVDSDITVTTSMTYDWDAGSGTWNASSVADWNPPGNGTVPGSTSDVTIGTGPGGTVTLTQNQTVDSLSITSGYTLAVEDTLMSAGAITVNTGGSLTLSGGTINASAITGLGTMQTQAGSTGTLDAVTIAAGATYTASDGAVTDILGTITDDGTLQVNGGGGANGFLNLTGNVTLNGSGAVTLSTASGGGSAFLEGNGLTLTNAITIQGPGVVGNGSLAVVNDGVIDANSAASTVPLLLDGSGGITDTNLLEAAGGLLIISSTTVDNAGGNIIANGSLSNVGLVNATLQGGTLNTLAGGTIDTVGGTTGTLDGSTNGALAISSGSTYTASDGATTDILGTIANAGAIEVNGGAGANGFLNLTLNVTLNGGGTVTLSTATGGGNAFLEGNGATLTNLDNTIQGSGVIGNGSLAVINDGLIDATPSGGTSTLTLNGSGGITNNNLLAATGGGTLSISSITVVNASGSITVADAASTVQLANATVRGGSLNNTAGGTLETTPGTTATLDGSTAAGAVTINGTYTASNGAVTDILGAITNNGTIEVNGGGGANGFLNLTGNVTLNGGGTVALSTTTGGGNAFLEGNGATLTNAGNTIQGTGVIGNGSLAVINGGVIDATPSGTTSTLTLDGSGGIINANGATGGLFEATAGGTLSISSVTVANANGNITVGDTSSTVQLANVTVRGGSLGNIVGGTLETAPGTTATLDGSTAAGGVTIYGAYTASNGAVTDIIGAITNNGAIGVIEVNGGAGNNGFLNLTGNVTLNGGGTVLLSTASGGGNAFLEGNGATLTNAGNTIEGTGIVGNGSLAVVNSGVIDADSSAGTGELILDGSGGVTNTNLLEATGGGTLQINSVTVDNAGGNITANGSGSVIQVVNAALQGGALNTLAGGTMATGTGSTATLDGSTNGALTISSGSTYTASNGALTDLVGTIANAGTIEVNGGGGNNGFLNLTGNATLDDGGTVMLSTATGGGNAFLEGNGATLTNAGTTIEGTGIIGNGSLAVVNSGTIDATPSTTTSTLTLDGSGGLTNTGTFEATNGGLLDVAVALGGAGQLKIGAGSEIELGGATNENATFLAGSAKLRIDNARSTAYGGVIAGFTLGNIIELGSTVATGVTPSFNGTNTVLTVSRTSGGPLTYTLAGNFSGDTFNVTLVNSGADSDITVTKSTTISTGIVLSNPATQNPYTVPANYYVTNTTTAHSGDAVYGTNAAAWNFTNLGTIKAAAVAATGVYLKAGGTVTNSGFISAVADGVVIGTDAGSVVNSGTVQGGNLGIWLEAGGAVTNSGAVAGTGPSGDGVTFGTTAGGTGTLVNAGVISGTNLAVWLDAGGNVTNAAGAVISATNNAVVIEHGTGAVTNLGTIENATTSTNSGIYLQDAGTVTNGAAGDTTALIQSNNRAVMIGFDGGAGTVINYGTIITTPAAATRFTVELFSGGTVTNSGSIISDATASGTGAIQPNAGGSVTNQAGGLVEGAVSGIVSQGSPGTIANFGTVERSAVTGTSGNAIYLGAGGLVTNYGMISGAGSAFLSGTVTARPAVVDAHNLAVTVRNFGTIASPANGSNGVNLLAGGTVVNGASGSTGATITGSETGIYMGGTLGAPTAGALGSVNNYGLIQGTSGTGVFLASGGTVTNAASGVITSAIDGVAIENAAGAVSNFGTIASATDVGVYLGAGGQVTNIGLIDSRAVNHGGVVLNNTVGTVINRGTIENTGSYNGVRFEAGGYLDNIGLVSGVNDGVLIGGTTATGAAAVVANLATITGAIGVYVNAGDTGNNTVTNAGVIIGTSGTAVQFGAGNNLLTVDPGAVFSGIVLGGSGSNTLELASAASSGALSGIGTNFVGFTTVEVDASAVWLLTGANTLAAGSTLATAGTLQDSGSLSVGGSFVDTGLVAIEGGAALDLLTGGTGSGSIAFASGAVLQIGSPGAPAVLANPITGFNSGDTIDLAGLVANGDTYAGGVLTLSNSGAMVAQLTLATPIASPVFTLASDGNGGTLVSVAPAPTNLFDFVFTYNGGADYYYGTVADNGEFGYFTNEMLSFGGGTYDIYSEAGTTSEASGTVSVTYYSHGGPGQASYTPVLTAAGSPDGTNGLGSEADSILGTNGGPYAFNPSTEATIPSNTLYGFVFNYSNGAAYYYGTVADNGSLGPYLSPSGSDGYYYVFSEGTTAEPSGTVIINGYRNGSSAATFSTVHPASGVDGSAGLGSETGSYYFNSTLFTFNDSMEATDPPVSVAASSSPNPSPPGGTTTDMILRRPDGVYEIYDIGNNAVLGGYELGQVGSDYVFAGLGNFNGADTTDMILRSNTTGAFEVYDISNDNVTASAPLGQVGLDWQVAGFGNFDGPGGGTDMMMRSNAGMFEVYDISNNLVTSANAFGQVGLDWQVAGFGNFNGDGTTDMMLRNVNTGMFEVYDIANNIVASANALGQVGLDWQVAGFGDFNGGGTTDMMLRNVNTGMFELYDIQNDKVTSASAIGQVGLEWQVAGFGQVDGAGANDMVLRDTQTGAFEVYDIANNQLTGATSLGAVGLEWQLGGFPADPPTGSTAFMTHPL